MDQSIAVVDNALGCRWLIPWTRRLRVPTLRLRLNTVGLDAPIASLHAHAFFEMCTSPRHPLADHLVIVLNRSRFARLILGRFLLPLVVTEGVGGDQNGGDSEYGGLHGVSD